MSNQPPMPPGQQQWGQQPAPAPKSKRNRIHWVAYPLVLIVGAAIGSSGGSEEGSTTAEAPLTSTSTPAAPQEPQESMGGSGGNNEAEAPETTTSTTKPAPRKTTERPDSPGIGDPVRDGKFEFTITKIRKGVKRVGNDMFGQDAQGQFIMVSVKVENIGDEPQTFTASGQKLFDSEGREFEADGAAAVYVEQSNSLYTPVNPGNATRGIMVFDVPRGATLTKLELHDSLFSGGVDVTL